MYVSPGGYNAMRVVCLELPHKYRQVRQGLLLRKDNEMRKITFAICIASIAIFILPDIAASGAIVVRHEGEIEGLVFDLSPGLPVELPGIPAITIKFIEIEASGIEQIVITPSGKYSYNCTLGPGKIYVWEEVPGLDENGIPLRYEDNSFVSSPDLTVMIGSATSNEHFIIPDFDPDDPDFDPHHVETPDDVDLYFTAILVGVLDTDNSVIPLNPPIPYKLKLKHGAVLFIMP
jgi:hypothetical protein